MIEYNGNVQKEEIYDVLCALMRNVKKQDDWMKWMGDDEEWTDGKVYKCLEICKELVERDIP